MKIGDLVNDKRCKTPRYGKTGLVMSVVDDMVLVMWPLSPEMPLWTSVDDLVLIT